MYAVCSHNPGGQKSKIKALAGFVSSEASLHGLYMVTSPYPHMGFPLYVSVSQSLLLFFFFKVLFIYLRETEIVR